MSDRRVLRTGKLPLSGEIASLCGDPWGKRSKADAISDIESGTHTYHVLWTTGRTEVRVVSDPRGKYLRTDADGTTRNNLLDLTDC